MSNHSARLCTAFESARRIASGALADVALTVKTALERTPQASILTFDDATGAVIDLDLRGTSEEVVSRLGLAHASANMDANMDANMGADASPNMGANVSAAPDQGERTRGRPRLGVMAREVTLMPRHWDWLGSQPGGASAALRRLVDEARRSDGGRTHRRVARDAAYRFMSVMAGDLPGFEEASRALFADDRNRFAELAAGWPADIRCHAGKLAWNPETGSEQHDR